MMTPEEQAYCTGVGKGRKNCDYFIQWNSERRNRQENYIRRL